MIGVLKRLSIVHLIRNASFINLMTTYKQRLEAFGDVPFGFCSNCGKSLNLEANADVLECECSSFLHPNANSSNMDDVELALVKAMKAHKDLVDDTFDYVTTYEQQS
jgi:hypothetical protein